MRSDSLVPLAALRQAQHPLRARDKTRCGNRNRIQNKEHIGCKKGKSVSRDRDVTRLVSKTAFVYRTKYFVGCLYSLFPSCFRVSRFQTLSEYTRVHFGTRFVLCIVLCIEPMALPPYRTENREQIGCENYFPCIGTDYNTQNRAPRSACCIIHTKVGTSPKPQYSDTNTNCLM